MISYIVHCTPPEGDIKISFKDNGQLLSFDFSVANLTNARLTDIFRKMPITEAEFIERANGGMTNYEKITI